MRSTGDLLLFDGDCGFCSSSADVATRFVAGRPGFAVVPFQRMDLTSVGLTADQAADAVWFVTADGRRFRGAAAVATALRHGRAPWPLLGLLLSSPGVRWLAARAYGWVAAHRYRLPGGTPACAVPRSADSR